jgi:hypothetical protein
MLIIIFKYRNAKTGIILNIFYTKFKLLIIILINL